VKQVVSGHTGHFRPFDFQENSARVTKAADSNHVVLSLPASKQTATWTIPSNSGKVKVGEYRRQYPSSFCFDLIVPAHLQTSRVDFSSSMGMNFVQGT
jgi:hypothetical protein